MTPLEEYVNSLQSAGRDVYIAGWSDEGSYALVVDNDRRQCSVATYYSSSSLGRWECSTAHRHSFAEIYAKRFPAREHAS